MSSLARSNSPMPPRLCDSSLQDISVSLQTVRKPDIICVIETCCYHVNARGLRIIMFVRRKCVAFSILHASFNNARSFRRNLYPEMKAEDESFN